MLDLERGVKIGGSRQYVLKGNGLRLHRAVQQLALDLLEEKGYTLLDVPVMVKEETLVSSGFFPGNRDQTYGIEAADDGSQARRSAACLDYGGETLDLARTEASRPACPLLPERGGFSRPRCPWTLQGSPVR